MASQILWDNLTKVWASPVYDLDGECFASRCYDGDLNIIRYDRFTNPPVKANFIGPTSLEAASSIIQAETKDQIYKYIVTYKETRNGMLFSIIRTKDIYFEPGGGAPSWLVEAVEAA
jgi:hypothetical protein